MSAPADWSRQVRDPEQARAVLAGLAAPADALDQRALHQIALDLRAAAPLDEAWQALGFRELVPGELVRPVDVDLPDLAATRALGARFAGALQAGDLLVLTGPLGAGKTSLTSGLGEALPVRGRVTSPTFVLARTHRGPLPLTHVDAYRLQESGAGELDDLELEAALEDGVVVVEWGEGLVEELVPSRLEVVLSRPDGGRDGRTASVRVHGPRWATERATQDTVATRLRAL